MTRASILDEILEHKRTEVDAAKRLVTPREMSERAGDFEPRWLLASRPR